MGSEIIVILSPAFNQYLGFLQGVKNLAIQQFITHLAVERFHIPVFPGTAWLDEQRFYVEFVQPFAQSIGDELGSIGDFDVWDAWTEPSLGRAHPDTLVMGTYKGIETVIWLEVEAGKKSEKEVVDDLMGRYKQARTIAEEHKVNLIFAVLSLPWALTFIRSHGLITSDTAIMRS